MIPTNMYVANIELPLLNNNKAERSIQNQGSTGAIFEELFSNAKNLVRETIQEENKATELTNDFIIGKNDNIHGLMAQKEKSGIMLQYTTQIRNKAIEAYQEIMRIPV